MRPWFDSRSRHQIWGVGIGVVPWSPKPQRSVRVAYLLPICSVISAGEGFPYKEEVGGSNPPQSTI